MCSGEFLWIFPCTDSESESQPLRVGRIGPQVGATPLLTWFSMGTLAIPMRWNRSVKATWMQHDATCTWLPGVVPKSKEAWFQDFQKLAVKHWRQGDIWKAQMKSAVANEKDVLYMTSSPFIIKLFATWSMKSGLMFYDSMSFYVYSFSLPERIKIYQDHNLPPLMLL